MASITHRSNRWQARIRRKGHPTQTRSFAKKQDAERWARTLEPAADRGTLLAGSGAEKLTLGEAIERYLSEVTPTLKGAKEDGFRLKALMRNPMCRLALANVTPHRIAQFRDERLRMVSAGTVIRELAYLPALINHARREWGFGIENPVSLVRKPAAPQGRNRILSPAEEVKLLDALEPVGRRNRWMLALVKLALETAMRRGELLALHWHDVSLTNRTAVLHLTKNSERRVVPLSGRAIEVLQTLPRSITVAVFPLTSYAACAAFKGAVKRAGIDDLRFHDLRHTAITRMADKLPNLIELAAVSGHKSLRMLQRYYHPKAEELALKLA